MTVLWIALGFLGGWACCHLWNRYSYQVAKRALQERDRQQDERERRLNRAEESVRNTRDKIDAFLDSSSN
jgi:hypothetical protein